MEKNNKKNVTKAAKTTKIVKTTTNTNQEVSLKNQIDYTSILNKIVTCLIAIIVLLSLNLVVNIVKGGNTSTKTTTESTTTEESGDYDVSSFNTLSTTDAISEIEKGGTQVVYIGRSTCGYCVKFLPVLKEAQENLGYTTTYIDLEQVTTDDQEKLVAYDSYISENFGYTPMVLVFKDGKFVDGWVGYAEYDDFASFLANTGIK